MSNARIERMVRELNSEPSSQFFQHLFGLVGLGEAPAKDHQPLTVFGNVGARRERVACSNA